MAYTKQESSAGGRKSERSQRRRRFGGFGCTGNENFVPIRGKKIDISSMDS